MNNDVRAAGGAVPDGPATGTPETPTNRTVRALAPESPLRGHLKLGEPEGAPDRIEVTSKWLERNGKPWFPITGEIHYSRLPRERWEETIGKAAAGGLNSIATYVIWQVHEPVQGEYRWDENRDLRAFIQICAKYGLDVIVRMGPWTHGEARNGGFPDWLLDLNIPLRTNDPQYLELVRGLYGQIIKQLEGLTHAEGGPIVGVQMDNELYNDSQHLATLRDIAEDLGLSVPMWTATGWGGAEVPDTLFPLYSAYSEGFWEDSTVEWPAFAPFHFLYSEVRDDLTVGKDLREALDGIVLDPDQVPLKDDSVIPFATCELGGGMHVAYHRRPLVTSDDVAKLALAKVGSGSIWQGYYMYSGGTVRRGPNGTEQESHATGYPNDVPTRSYDFYAPLSEHTQVRPHYNMLRRQHLWFEQDGSALAAMRTVIGGGSEDPSELRWAVRTDGHRGYAFFTTYQPAKRAIDAQPGVQVQVEFDDTTVMLPTHPVDLPQNVSVAWPLRYPVTSDLTLRSATAEVLTRITDESGEIFVLAETAGIPVELVFEGTHEVTGAGRAEIVDGHTVAALTQPAGLNTLVQVDGVRILILDDTSATSVSRLTFAGRERLVVTSAPVYVTAAGEGGGELVIHPEAETTTVAILPAAELTPSEGTVTAQADGLWSVITLTAPGAGASRIVENLSVEADVDPQPVYGGPMNRLTAPTDFTQAAHVRVGVPGELLSGVDRALLRITWQGDVGRAVIGDDVVSDHFWYGREWDVDLTPYAEQVAADGVTLQLMPWKRELGVWVDPAVRDIADGISVQSIDVVRIPRIVLSAKG